MAPVTCRRALLIGAFAAVSHGAPAHLRSPGAGEHLVPDASSDGKAWQQSMEALFTSFSEREPAAAKAEGKAAKGKSPIEVEVPEKELKALLAKLSPSCKGEVSTLLDGALSGFHASGKPRANGTTMSCGDFKGGLCSMTAHVSQYAAQNNRDMSTTTSRRGEGCVPNSCNQGTDLEVLATFMQMKAKSVLPGGNGNIRLSVDCTKAGGSAMEVGSVEEVASNDAKVGSSAEEEAPVRVARKGRNGGTQVAAGPVSLAMVLFAVCGQKM